MQESPQLRLFPAVLQFPDDAEPFRCDASDDFRIGSHDRRMELEMLVTVPGFGCTV